MHFIQNLKDILDHIIIPTAYAADSSSASGPVQMFGLDWKLFIAQLVNFSIVLFVLWKWVFGPLGQKLSERTEKIEKSLAQARDIEQQHREAQEQKIAELEKTRKEAAEIIARAEKLAQQSKAEILAEARESAEKIAAQNKVQLEDQKAKMLREIKEEAANLVVMATEKILREKLDPKKDEKIIKEALKNL